MTIIEILLIILVILVLAFLAFWFFQGSTGRISVRRPVESRVDEYLDRRFARLIDEWGVVRRPAVTRFREDQGAVLDSSEARISELKGFEADFNGTLSELEERLDALEKAFDRKRPGK
ncbi:MAG: hypothetical protein LUQ07_07500 [Methanospirillum sp.]|nr:hypothetical protein [Methanospirillum sp.]